MIFASLVILPVFAQQPPEFQHINFDDNWRFALGNAADPNKDFGFGRTGMGYLAKAGAGEGPVSAGYGDGKWRLLNLPHDWVIELPFNEKAEGGHGFKEVGREFPENSVGWYRKSFTIGREMIGKRISLHFDGIYRDARVWCNGTFIKRNESGYIGFDADITNQIRYGAKNNVTVRVDASEFEGWFYEGAGIYRHTYLNINDPASLVKDGQFLMPKVVGNIGKVDANLEVINRGEKDRHLRVDFSIETANGSTLVLGKSMVNLAGGQSASVTPTLTIKQP